MRPPANPLLHTAEEFRTEARKPNGKVLAIRKELAGVAVKANADGTIDFTLSTATPDRSNDVITQSGWKLDNYLKNPVMLFAHDYSQLPVGRPGTVGVDGDALKAKCVAFPERDTYEFGWTVGQMYSKGFLHAVSVGFRPLKWNYVDGTAEGSRSGYGVDFIEQELLEFSAVPVPANPEALIGAKAAGIPLGPLVEWAERILDQQDPEERQKLSVPREYVEKMWAIAKPAAKHAWKAPSIEKVESSRLKAMVERDPSYEELRALTEETTGPADEPDDDVLVLALDELAKSIRKLTRRIDSLDATIAKGVAMPLPPPKPEPTKAAPPPAPVSPAPADVAKAIADAVRTQLSAAFGRPLD